MIYPKITIEISPIAIRGLLQEYKRNNTRGFEVTSLPLKLKIQREDISRTLKEEEEGSRKYLESVGATQEYIEGFVAQKRYEERTLLGLAVGIPDGEEVGDKL